MYRTSGLTLVTCQCLAVTSHFRYLFCIKQQNCDHVETHQTQVELVCDTTRQIHHSNSKNEFSTDTMEFTDATILQAQWGHARAFFTNEFHYGFQFAASPVAGARPTDIFLE